MANTSPTPLQQAAKSAAETLISQLGDGPITPAMLLTVATAAFEQGAGWNQQQYSFLDEALNSGDGSYRP